MFSLNSRSGLEVVRVVEADVFLLTVQSDVCESLQASVKQEVDFSVSSQDERLIKS